MFNIFACCSEPTDKYYQDIIFYPGSTGLKINMETGLISDISDNTLAKTNNIQIGWTIEEIEGQTYDFDLLMKYRNGDQPYWITFHSEKPIINVPHQVMQSSNDDAKHSKKPSKIEIADDGAPAIVALGRDSFLTYEIPSSPDLKFKGQKGKYTHFVNLDDTKQCGRYFECNVDDNVQNEEGLLYVECHDGDEKFVSYSNVFTLELATELGSVIAYWDKGTHSYALSGQATEITDTEIMVKFDDGDGAFIPKQYVYQKLVVPNPAQLYIVTAEYGDALYSGTKDELLVGDAKYEGRCAHQALLERVDNDIYLDQYGFPNYLFKVLENEYESEIGKFGYLGLKAVTQKYSGIKVEDEEKTLMQSEVLNEESCDAEVGFVGQNEHTPINDHSILVGTEVRLLSSRDEFVAAFENSDYNWHESMTELLGARVKIVDRPEMGIFGLPACGETSKQPIWYYPFSVIDVIVDVEAEAKLYIVTAKNGETLYSGTKAELLVGDAKYEDRLSNQALVQRIDDEMYMDKYGFANGYFKVIENEYESAIGKCGYLGINTVTQKIIIEEEERQKKLDAAKPIAEPVTQPTFSSTVIESEEQESTDEPLIREPTEAELYIVTAEHGEALYSGTKDELLAGDGTYEGRCANQAVIQRLDDHLYMDKYGFENGYFKVLENEYESEIGKCGYLGMSAVTQKNVFEEQENQKKIDTVEPTVEPVDQPATLKESTDEPNYYMNESTHNSIKSTLGTFDKDGDGKIDPEELRYALECAGKFVTDEELDEIIRNADTNGDGIIDMDEFVHAFSNSC